MENGGNSFRKVLFASSEEEEKHFASLKLAKALKMARFPELHRLRPRSFPFKFNKLLAQIERCNFFSPHYVYSVHTQSPYSLEFS